MTHTEVVGWRPSMSIRLMEMAGFKLGAHAGRPDDDEARYMVHRIVTHWDFLDRIRLLVSGVTETEICVQVEPPEPVTFLGGEVGVLGLRPIEIKSVMSDAVVVAPWIKRLG